MIASDWAQPDYVRLHAQTRPNQLACVDLASNSRWTYSRLDADASLWAEALSERFSVKEGDRIAALAHNAASLLILRLACMRLGALYAPLNWRLAQAELQVLLADLEPKLLVHDDAHANAAEAQSGMVPLSLAQLQAEGASVQRAQAIQRSALTQTIILYTSGSTGRPKGALLNEQNVFFTALNFSSFGEVTGSSVMLVDAPMFHVIGLVASLGAALMQGGTALISPGFDASRTLARMTDPTLGVTHYFCVPQMAQRLRASPAWRPERLGALKAIFTGGAPNAAANIRRSLAEGVRMVDGYGMTEAGTVLGMPLDRQVLEQKAGAAGLPPPTLSVRLVDIKGRDVPQGEVGELWVRGPNVISGYWRRPEDTEAAFSAGGWFRSGDLARCDADGFVTIVGRRKEMFISGGENVYPAEVEACLVQCSDVVEVAVIGVPDPTWGEVGVAYVVMANPSSNDEPRLRAHCELRVAHFKIPRRFVFLEALPRTGTGKVRKELLRERE